MRKLMQYLSTWSVYWNAHKFTHLDFILPIRRKCSVKIWFAKLWLNVNHTVGPHRHHAIAWQCVINKELAIHNVSMRGTLMFVWCNANFVDRSLFTAAYLTGFVLEHMRFQQQFAVNCERLLLHMEMHFKPMSHVISSDLQCCLKLRS